RMLRVVLPGELTRQIGIALPVTEVWPHDGPVAAGREPAVRECIRENVTYRFLEFRTAGEVPALMGCIAPGSVLGPVPGGHAEFAVVAIGNWSPSCGQRFLDDVRSVDLVDAA